MFGSVDLAGHGVVVMAAGRSVLGRCAVAQGRMPVTVVVLVLEVAMQRHGPEKKRGPGVLIRGTTVGANRPHRLP